MNCLRCGEPILDGDAVIEVGRMRDSPSSAFTTREHFGHIHFRHLATEGSR